MHHPHPPPSPHRQFVFWLYLAKFPLVEVASYRYTVKIMALICQISGKKKVWLIPQVKRTGSKRQGSQNKKRIFLKLTVKSGLEPILAKLFSRWLRVLATSQDWKEQTEYAPKRNLIKTEELAFIATCVEAGLWISLTVSSQKWELPMRNGDGSAASWRCRAVRFVIRVSDRVCGVQVH